MTVDMSIEVWKDIPDYEGIYQVSNFGRIRSLDRYVTHKNGAIHFKAGQIQTLQDNGNGRLYKQLKVNGKGKNYYVSRAVMLAFVGERPEGYHICHIDGNIKNNRLDNLRYDSPTENNIDQFRHDNGRKNHSTSLETVLKIRQTFKTNNYTTKELAEMFNVSVHVIRGIVNNRTFQWLNDDGTIRPSKTAITY